MGRTSSAVKRRYNQKAYDRITVFVKAGEKEVIRTLAERNGESLNGYIYRLIKQDIEKSADV